MNTYNSDWFDCVPSGTYTLRHGLGSDVPAVTVQFRDTGNALGLGVNAIYPALAQVQNLTATELTVQADAHNVACRPTSGGARVGGRSGQYRVLATRIL